MDLWYRSWMEEPSCLFTDILSSGVCFEYWFNRYQALLVGLIASVLVFRQVQIMREQTKISREQAGMIKTQEVIVAKQQDISEAQAKASVLEALSTVANLHHWALSHQSRNLGAWSVNGVPDREVKSVSGDVIAVAYPDRIEDIVSALSSAARLNAVYQRYIKDPWPVQFPGDEQAKIDAAPRMEDAEDALKKFSDAFSKVRDLAEL